MRHYVTIDYRNHRDERRSRKIWPIPGAVYLAPETHPYHPRLWVVGAIDLERIPDNAEELDPAALVEVFKAARRDFALCRIYSWSDDFEPDAGPSFIERLVGGDLGLIRVYELVARAAAEYVCAGPPGSVQEGAAFVKLVGELTLGGLVIDRSMPRLGGAPLEPAWEPVRGRPIAPEDVGKTVLTEREDGSIEIGRVE